MDVVPFVLLCFSAALMFLNWFNEGPPRRIVSLNFALFVFIVGLIFLFALNDETFLHEEKDILTEKTKAYKQLLWSLICGLIGYGLGWAASRRKYIKHGT